LLGKPTVMKIQARDLRCCKSNNKEQMSFSVFTSNMAINSTYFINILIHLHNRINDDAEFGTI
jgi:hypothetical protein